MHTQYFLRHPDSVNRFVLSFFGVLAFSLVHANGSLVARYRLRVSEDTQRLARLSGKEAPYGRLDLREGGRFVLMTDDSYRRGRYVVEKDRLVLLPETGREIRGDVKADVVTVEGLNFERVESALEVDPRLASDPARGRRFPTDASTGRGAAVLPAASPVEVPVILAAPDDKPAPQSGSFGSPFPKPVAVAVPDLTSPAVMPAATIPVVAAPAPVAPARRRFVAADLEGTWTVWREGREEKGQRMQLKKDGKFRFEMKGATSEGAWTVEEGQIVLTYTKVDGEPIEEGASGRKEIRIADDGSAFQIDTYRYERASGK